MSGYTTRPLRDRTWLRPADKRAALLAAVAVLSGRSDVTDLTKRWGERS